MNQGTPENQVDPTSTTNEEDVDPIEAFAEITQENAATPATNPADEDQSVTEGDEYNASQPEANASPSEADTGDLWAQATDPQRVEFQKVQSANAELEHRYRSSNGRVSALQKQINTLQSQITQGQNAPVSEAHDAAKAAGLTDEQIKEFEEDYGDISAFVKGFAQTQINEAVRTHVAPVQQQMSQIQQQQQHYAAKEAEDATANEYNRLAAAHPDFQQIQNDQSFWTWLDAKPAFIKDAIQSTSADDNIELLNQFKRETFTGNGGRPSSSTDSSVDLAAHAELPTRGASKVAEQEPTDPVELFNLIANQ